MKYNLDPNQILLLAQGELVEVNGQKVQLTVVEERIDIAPVKSMKYKDCAERVNPMWYVNSYARILEIEDDSDENNVPTQRNAKQVLAFCQLLTIMHDANGGEWIPKDGEAGYCIDYGRGVKQLRVDSWFSRTTNPIQFKTEELAQQALEENRQIFLDFFGIEEGFNE